MGGLGNQMYQIAMGETWRKRGHEVVYTNMDENLDYISRSYDNRRHAFAYKGIFINFDWDKHKSPPGTKLKQIKVPFTYTEIVPADGNEYVGYLQSEKFWDDKDFIKELFRTTFIPTRPERSCSIHVRRGDYLKLAEHHTNLSEEYYKAAMATLVSLDIEKYYVFSDDIQWCRVVFSDNRFVIYNNVDYICMEMMSKCCHNIIANSSLSWWGAWLGEQDDTVIVAPKEWFPKGKEDASDIIPDRWIKI